MSGDVVGEVEKYIVSLLRTLDAIGFITRHLSPIGYSHQLERVGAPEGPLREAWDGEGWDDPYSALRPLLDQSCEEALAAMDGLRAATAPPEDMMAAYQALRHFPRALETLYPLAGIVPPINRFFLDPEFRHDKDLRGRLMKQPPPPQTGVLCLGDDPASREAVWVYVPETYDPAQPHPVAFVLHGGSGRGRAFLWSWVRAARARGVIIAAPTSVAQTWAIQGEDRDTPRLAEILAFVRQTWNIDASHVLMTGMSDGGTFTWTSGLESESPFTHLAPVAAAFHPMLATIADAGRLTDLPIHIIHGAQDWMFPVDMAREAERYFKARGSAVTYREIDDLSHTYSAELSSMILDWLLA